jgi:hypothetical protein
MVFFSVIAKTPSFRDYPVPLPEKEIRKFRNHALITPKSLRDPAQKRGFIPG